MELKSNWSKHKTENVIRWISIAIRDRGVANHLFYGDYFENAVYNLQQASEKLLKAFLVANDMEIEKTHNIDSLLVSAGMVDQSILNLKKVGSGSTKMSRFATHYRYPNWDKNDFSDVDEVIEASRFSDVLYAYLAPFFGDQILEKAVQYSRVKFNAFETGLKPEEKESESCLSGIRPKP